MSTSLLAAAMCLRLWVIGLGVGGAQVEPMFVAGNDDLIAGNVQVNHIRGTTEEHDGVQCHFKLRTGANKGAAHGLHLHAESTITLVWQLAVCLEAVWPDYTIWV